MFDESFGIIPIFLKKNKIEFLLLQNKNWGHRWFPKWHIEKWEQIINSAIREFEEETWISKYYLHILSDNFFIENYSFFDKFWNKIEKTVKYRIWIVDTDFDIQIQEKEILNYKICNFEKALNTITFEESKNTMTNVQIFLNDNNIADKLQKKIKISIDWFGGTGKSSTTKIIWNKLWYLYIDSGAIYRAITVFVIENNLADNIKQLDDKLKSIKIEQKIKNNTTNTYLNWVCVNEKLRTQEVNQLVAKIADVQSVRFFVNTILKKIWKSGGVIMDGRDIWSEVWPDAELKVYMQTDIDIRSKRRYLEIKDKNPKVTIEQIKKNISDRDFLDKQRIDVLFQKFENDVFVLDNTRLSIEQQVWEILEKYYSKLI